MKRIVLLVLSLMMLWSMSFAEVSMPALEIWAQFNDNQKALYSVLDEVEGEIELVFEYLGCFEMAGGSREVVDMLFIIAPEAEHGLYVLDIETGEFYDHINDKKVGELKDREHIANTLANCWVSGNTEFLWYDSEVKIYMDAEEIQAVLDAAA